MTPAEIQSLFTRSTGEYLCARWGRPIVPVVFGVEDATLSVVKGAVEAVVMLAGHRMAETDPELGANLMVFFFRDWAELPQVPKLDRMIPDLLPLCDRLEKAGANQYRIFRFDADGAIKAAFVFIRMDADLEAVPAETLALQQAAQIILGSGASGGGGAAGGGAVGKGPGRPGICLRTGRGLAGAQPHQQRRSPRNPAQHLPHRGAQHQRRRCGHQSNC